jgi:hypothetical protein
MSAVKVFLKQLFEVKQDGASFVWRGTSFRKVWLEGIVIGQNENTSSFMLDDGSGVILVNTKKCHQQTFQKGEYVMVVGPFRNDAVEPTVLAHQVIAIDDCFREGLWFLEVVDYWKMRHE